MNMTTQYIKTWDMAKNCAMNEVHSNQCLYQEIRMTSNNLPMTLKDQDKQEQNKPKIGRIKITE